MTDLLNKLHKEAEIHMQKYIDNFKKNINKIYIGRISPNTLDTVQVEYYGRITPLSQLTNSVVENAHTLNITVFDPKMIKIIEKAILVSDLKLTPVVCRNVIRVTLPLLTENRRRTLVKMVRIEAEKNKISIRHVRRVMNDKSKILLKNKKINEDEEHYFQNEIQKLTNTWIKNIDSVLTEKELELMKF